MEAKPIITEKFADNGEHSHYELVNEHGEVLCSELVQSELQEKVEKLEEVCELFRRAGVGQSTDFRLQHEAIRKLFFINTSTYKSV